MTSYMNHSPAEVEGHFAHDQGRHLDGENPYEPHTYQHLVWRKGWLQREDQLKLRNPPAMSQPTPADNTPTFVKGEVAWLEVIVGHSYCSGTDPATTVYEVQLYHKGSDRWFNVRPGALYKADAQTGLPVIPDNPLVLGDEVALATEPTWTGKMIGIDGLTAWVKWDRPNDEDNYSSESLLTLKRRHPPDTA